MSTMAGAGVKLRAARSTSSPDAPGQVLVGQHQVEAPLVHEVDGFLRRSGGGHPVPPAPQRLAQHGQHDGLVVDHQHLVPGRHDRAVRLRRRACRRSAACRRRAAGSAAAPAQRPPGCRVWPASRRSSSPAPRRGGAPRSRPRCAPAAPAPTAAGRRGRRHRWRSPADRRSVRHRPPTSAAPAVRARASLSRVSGLSRGAQPDDGDVRVA